MRHLACPFLKHIPARLVQLQLQPQCDLALFYPTSRVLTAVQPPSVEGLVSARCVRASRNALVGAGASYSRLPLPRLPLWMHRPLLLLLLSNARDSLDARH